ncbi:MAG: hypothetical protein QXF25_02405 [Candidatus Pacearchaeota archaeon]
MAVNVLGLLYFMPIFSFLFVFVIVYALLKKTQVLGDNDFMNALVGVIVATAFITASSARTYVETITPWFAVLIVAMFFILAVIGFSQQKIEGAIGKNIMIGFVFVLILVFFFSGVKVFSSGVMPIYYRITENERLIGGILVFFVAGVMSWIVTRK